MSYGEDDIARIARGLIDRTLPKAEWTHAAHFAAALWLVRHHPDPEGAMPGLIRAYNVATGGVNSDAEGYHETITRASLAAVRAALEGAPGAGLAEVHARMMASRYGRADWVLEHWSRDVLFSVAARRGWVGPDVARLPW